MRVLIACEFSGIIRNEFSKRGFDAWSCDLLPSESEGNHILDNVLNHLDDNWDLMIAHPPCTHLATSGARWFGQKKNLQKEALEFVRTLMRADIKHIAIENPMSIIVTHLRKPDQIIQPYEFGHGEMKTTCLWLKNLPKLRSTKIVEGREQKCWKSPDSKNRWKRRSLTYVGIAEAMADQWGNFIVENRNRKFGHFF